MHHKKVVLVVIKTSFLGALYTLFHLFLPQKVLKNVDVVSQTELDVALYRRHLLIVGLPA